MLDTIRKNASSWGVKIIFAIIALVFVFWGVGSFRSRNKGILAKVDDTYIKVRDFAEVYQRELTNLRARWKNISESTLNKLGLKRRIFDRMVNDIILEKLCRQLGIVVPPSKIKENIENTKFFWNKENKFDFNKYKELLAYAGMTPAVYEMKLEKEFMKQKLFDFISLASYVPEEQVKDVFNFMFQRAKIKYLDFPFKRFEKDVKISEKEIKEYYEEHKNRFIEEAKIKIKYILITPEELAKVQNVTEKEMRDYYDTHKDDFKTKPMVKLRVIYIKLTKDMNQKEVSKKKKKLEIVLSLLKKGKDFSEIAKKYSEDLSAKSGGYLGWLEKDSLLPLFKKEVETMKVGDISKPIQTDRGVYILKLEDKKASRIKPFEEVKDKIRSIISKEKALEDLDASLDKALETLLQVKDPSKALQKAAESVGLLVHESDFFTKGEGISKFKMKQEDIDSLFKLSKGKVLETPIMLKNGYMIAQKIDEKPRRVKKLDEVKEEIKSIIKEQKIKVLAKKEAKKVFLALKKGKEKEFEKEIKESDYFTRQGYIPPLGYNLELTKQVFSSPLNKWLNKVFEFSDRYVIAKPVQKLPPEKDLWAKERKRWEFLMYQNNRNLILTAFLNNLKKGVPIKILAPEILK